MQPTSPPPPAVEQSPPLAGPPPVAWQPAPPRRSRAPLIIAGCLGGFGVALVLLTILGVLAVRRTAAAGKQADGVARQFLADVDAGNENEAWALASGAYQQSTGRKEFRAVLGSWRTLTGRFQSVQKEGVDWYAGTGGTRVTLSYRVTGSQSAEIVTMVVVSQGGPFRVQSCSFTPVRTPSTGARGFPAPVALALAGFAYLKEENAPLPALATGRASGLAAGAAPRSAPYNWRNVQIVGGGFVPGIEFSPARKGLIYCRTDIGGAYRWDSASGRWQPLMDWMSPADWNLMGVESIAPDPTNARVVYAAVGTYTQPWAGDGAILRSGDQGRTWEMTRLPFKLGGNEDGRSMGERLAVDPNDPRLLYFASRQNGLWRSADSARTCEQVRSFPTNGLQPGIGLGFVVFDRASGSPGSPTPAVYVGSSNPESPLLHSQDAGASWAPVPGQPTGLIPHHAAFGARGSLYVTYCNGPGPNGVSGGATWKLQSGRWSDITPLKPGSDGRGGFGYAGLAVDPERPGAVMVSTLDRWNPGDEIYRSTDGGLRWRPLSPQATRDASRAPYLRWGKKSPNFGWWIGALALDPFDSGHVLYGTGATIWGTSDVTAADRGAATHWLVAAEGIEETAVLGLISPPQGAHLISALGDIGGFRHGTLTASPPEGMCSNPIFTTTTSLDFAALRPEIVARSGFAGREVAPGAWSGDNGATWQPFASRPPGIRQGGGIAVSAGGGAFVWALSGAVPCWSSDRGASWRACEGLSAGTEVVADRATPGRFYALDRAADRLYVSTDRGARFTPVAGSLPSGAVRLLSAPGAPGDLWLVAGKHLYHSPDAGGRWRLISPDAQVAGVGFGAPAPGTSRRTLFMDGSVRGEDGIFRSTDGGQSWLRINDSRHQFGWNGPTIIGDPRVFGRVYIGTNGRGILYGEPGP